MAKPPVSKVRDVAKFDVATPKVRDVAKFEVTGSLVELGARLGISLDGDLSVHERLDRAALNISRAAQAMLMAGVDLLAIRAQAEHGTFLEMVEERGMSRDSAYRAISYAQFVSSRTPDEQDRLLALPKSKVLELAKADPAVVDELLQDDGPIDLGMTSVREMRDRILQLERAQTDIKVQLSTAVSERDAAHKRLAKAHRPNRKDQVPTVIADIRAEGVVAHHKLQRVIEDLHPMVAELQGYQGSDAHDWVEPSANMILAGLVAAHTALGHQLQKFAEAFGLTHPVISDPAFDMTEQEVKDVARAFDMSTRHDAYEKALREFERAKDRPRGKGRPAAKPEAPEDYTGEA